jgi:hypothetical protein
MQFGSDIAVFFSNAKDIVRLLIFFLHSNFFPMHLAAQLLVVCVSRSFTQSS